MDNFIKGLICGSLLMLGGIAVSQNFGLGMICILAGFGMIFVEGK